MCRVIFFYLIAEHAFNQLHDVTVVERICGLDSSALGYGDLTVSVKTYQSIDQSIDQSINQLTNHWLIDALINLYIYFLVYLRLFRDQCSINRMGRRHQTTSESFGGLFVSTCRET